jgi:hypothetical protein
MICCRARPPVTHSNFQQNSDLNKAIHREKHRTDLEPASPRDTGFASIRAADARTRSYPDLRGLRSKPLIYFFALPERANWPKIAR